MPCDVAKPIGFAVAAAKEKDQSVARLKLKRNLPRIVFVAIGQAAVLNYSVARDGEIADWRNEPPHIIAECIKVSRRRDLRRRRERRPKTNSLIIVAVRVEKTDHQGRLRAAEGYLVAVTN